MAPHPVCHTLPAAAGRSSRTRLQKPCSAGFSLHAGTGPTSSEVIQPPRAEAHCLRRQGCDSWETFCCASPASLEWNPRASRARSYPEVPGLLRSVSVHSWWAPWGRCWLLAHSASPLCRGSPWPCWPGTLFGFPRGMHGYRCPPRSRTRFLRWGWCHCG